uniref:Uncharacterized protein n=1 Tax=Meloidogyne javanica TaxID=6303 RepID=A0A915MZD6_MELJA
MANEDQQVQRQARTPTQKSPAQEKNNSETRRQQIERDQNVQKTPRRYPTRDRRQLKEMCRNHVKNTSTWGFHHRDFGQGSASGNWEYPQHNQYFSGHQQQNYGYLTDYVNQQIPSHQQAFGDYTGSGHEQYTGHLEGDTGIQGGSGDHGKEDMDTEEGEFDD